MFREVMLGGEKVADALLEFLLKLQLEVAVDLFALGQEHWHALHNLLKGERLLLCVLKAFALKEFNVLLNLGCMRDGRLEPGNMLGVQLPPGGVSLQGKVHTVDQCGLGRLGPLGCMVVEGIDHVEPQHAVSSSEPSGTS